MSHNPPKTTAPAQPSLPELPNQPRLRNRLRAPSPSSLRLKLLWIWRGLAEDDPMLPKPLHRVEPSLIDHVLRLTLLAAMFFLAATAVTLNAIALWHWLAPESMGLIAAERLLPFQIYSLFAAAVAWLVLRKTIRDILMPTHDDLPMSWPTHGGPVGSNWFWRLFTRGIAEAAARDAEEELRAYYNCGEDPTRENGA